MAEDENDFFTSLENEGVDPALISRIRDFSKASPLRHAKKQAEKTAQELAEENEKLRKVVLKNTFKDAGVRIDPSLLNLPPDLDYASVDAVKTWATQSNLLSTDPSVDQEELQELDQINNLAEGADTPRSGVITPSIASEWPVDRMRRFMASNPVEWEQLKRGNEVSGVTAPN